MSESVDILLVNATIVTVDQHRRIIEDGSIAVRDGRIVGVGKTEQIKSMYHSTQSVDLSGHAIFPGLINTNTHLFQTLLKGLGDDRSLINWFTKMTVPAATQLTQDDCHISALLGCIESIRSGTTTIVDCMYTHSRPLLADGVVRAFQEAGVRGIVQRGFSDIGEETGVLPALIETVSAALNDTSRLIQEYESDIIHIWLSPLAIFCASEEALIKSREFADKHNCRLSIHLGESSYFPKFSETKYNSTELEHMDRIGFLGPDVQAVHAVWVTERDMRIMKAYDVKVSHQPVSNMYLADGVAPIPRMLSMGIIVGLGTDGAASNNNQDMINVLKTTSLLQKVVTLDPTITTAEKVLEMATIDGAKSIGLEQEIGSIEVGKRADLLALNLKSANTAPGHHPVSALVYASTTRDIDFTMVNGRILMQGGRILTLDEPHIIDMAIGQANELVERAGLQWLKNRSWRSVAF